VEAVKRPARGRSEGKTVLIVEDNPTIRKRLAEAFLADGFKACKEAGNGQDGIEIAREIKPDVIILDLAMPIMNGLQAAPKLRQLCPKTPIILFTLYGSEQLTAEAPQLGIDLVLPKTDPLSTVIERARELMGD
jgi:CheY-like chemotaxis protein